MPAQDKPLKRGATPEKAASDSSERPVYFRSVANVDVHVLWFDEPFPEWAVRGDVNEGIKAIEALALALPGPLRWA